MIDPITDIDWQFFKKNLFTGNLDDEEFDDYEGFNISYNSSQYSYVINNPISFVDLYGFDTLNTNNIKNIDLPPVDVTRGILKNENFYVLGQGGQMSDEDMSRVGPLLIFVTKDFPKSWIGLPKTGVSGTNSYE